MVRSYLFEICCAVGKYFRQVTYARLEPFKEWVVLRPASAISFEVMRFGSFFLGVATALASLGRNPTQPPKTSRRHLTTGRHFTNVLHI